MWEMLLDPLDLYLLVVVGDCHYYSATCSEVCPDSIDDSLFHY